MSYVIWSHQHEAWWRPNALGYTTDLTEAGRYTASEAMVPVINDVLHNEIAIHEKTAMEVGPPRFHPYDGPVADRELT